MENKLKKDTMLQRDFHLKRKGLDIKYNELISNTLGDEKNLVMVLDLETTGLPITKSFNDYFHYSNLDKYDGSRIVQFSWGIYKQNGEKVLLRDFVIKPSGFTIPDKSTKIHGIPHNYAKKYGIELIKVIECLEKDINKINVIVAHNLIFDINVLLSELYRFKNFDLINKLKNINNVCTAQTTKDIIQIKIIINYEYIYKLPNLAELYYWCFQEKIEGAHNSKNDVINLSKIYFYLKNEKNIY
jgi:DNA polymerase III epsilon subunit-like protein